MVSKKNLTTIKLKTFCNCQNIFSTNFSGCHFNRQYTHESSVVSSFAEFNNTVSKCEQCKVSSDSYIFTCMVFRAALANENISGDGRLAAIDFYTEAFAL